MLTRTRAKTGGDAEVGRATTALLTNRSAPGSRHGWCVTLVRWKPPVGNSIALGSAGPASQRTTGRNAHPKPVLLCGPADLHDALRWHLRGELHDLRPPTVRVNHGRRSMSPRAVEILPAPDLEPAHDPGFGEASARAEIATAVTPADQIGAPILTGTSGAHEILVGTASWTDPTMTRGGVFYPPGTSTSEDRLRYYASQFPVVEVDSTYYSLPERATAALWAERTPADFTFHVKAHALMTGQPTEVARLPEGLIEVLPADLAEKKRIYAKDLPLEVYDAVWTHFLDALGPLGEQGKLGGILLQYPRWFLPNPANKHQLAESARRLAGIPTAVEFRNQMWFGSERSTSWTLDMLRDLGLTHVIVDGPQGLESSVPAVPAVTTPDLAVVRLHGRRSATWEAAKVPTVERYRYLYSEEQLRPIAEQVEEAASVAARTTVLLNNCYGNYGSTNARELVAELSS